MRNNQGKNNLRINVDADTSKLDKDLNKSLNKTQEIRKAFRENLNKGIDMLDRKLLPPMEEREALAREHFEGRTMNLEGKRLQIAKEQLALSEKRKKNEEEIALIKEQLRDAESRKQTFSSTASSLKNQTNTKLEEMSLLANKERQLKSELAKIEENLAKYSDRRMEQLQGKLKSAAEQVNQLKQEIESLGDVSTGRVDSLKNETNEIAKQKDLVEKRLEAQLKSVNLTRTATKDDVGRTLAELENRKRQLLVSPRTGQSITEDEYYAQPLKYQTRDKTNELKKLNEDIKFLSTEGSGTFKGLTNELESLSREYDSLLQKVGDLNTKLQTKQSLESQLSKALPKEIEARNNLESFKESQPRRVEELQGHKAVAEANLKSVADEMEELNATYRENSEALRINNEEKDRAIEQATKLKSQLETLKEAQSTVTKETQKDIKANKQLYTELKVAAEQRDSTAKFFTDQMKQYVSWTLAIGTMVKTLRASYAFISELDKALTEIATTTKMTSEQTWQLAKDYNVLGKELSKSTVEIAQSAAIFYRQGKSIAETNSMMRSVIVASSLEGVPMEETASRITAALNAYKKEATEAMSVTSKFAAVGAASATSFGELSYALTKVGAGANLAGFDFDHLLGTLATVLETTREAPENIGTAWKTIIARINQITKPDFMEGMLDEEGEPIYFSRVDEALSSIGISLKTAQGQFKPFSELLDEMGRKWAGLDQNQKAYLATVVAGTRQQTRFVAAMDNYDKVLNLTSVSSNSAGEAMNQYNVYLDSVEAHQQRVRASFDALIMSFQSTDSVKNVLSLFKGLLDALTALSNFIGVVPAVAGAAMAGFRAYEMRGAKRAYNSMKNSRITDNQEYLKTRAAMGSDEEKLIFEAQTKHGIVNDLLDNRIIKQKEANYLIARENALLKQIKLENQEIIQLEGVGNRAKETSYIKQKKEDIERSMRLKDYINLQRQSALASYQASPKAQKLNELTGGSTTVLPLLLGGGAKALTGIKDRVGVLLNTIKLGLKGLAVAAAPFMATMVKMAALTWVLGKAWEFVSGLISSWFDDFSSSISEGAREGNTFYKILLNWIPALNNIEKKMKQVVSGLSAMVQTADKLPQLISRFQELQGQASLTAAETKEMNDILLQMIGTAASLKSNLDASGIQLPEETKQDLDIMKNVLQVNSDGKLTIKDQEAIDTYMKNLNEAISQSKFKLLDFDVELQVKNMKEIDNIVSQAKDQASAIKSMLQSGNSEELIQQYQTIQTYIIERAGDMIKGSIHESGKLVEDYSKSLVSIMEGYVQSQATYVGEIGISSKEYESRMNELRDNIQTMINQFGDMPQEQMDKIESVLSTPIDLTQENFIAQTEKGVAEAKKIIYDALGEELGKQFTDSLFPQNYLDNKIQQALDSLADFQTNVDNLKRSFKELEELAEKSGDIANKLMMGTMKPSEYLELIESPQIKEYLEQTGDYALQNGKAIYNILIDQQAAVQRQIELKKRDLILAREQLNIEKNKLIIQKNQEQIELKKAKKKGDKEEIKLREDSIKLLENSIDSMNKGQDEMNKSIEFYGNITKGIFEVTKNSMAEINSQNLNQMAKTHQEMGKLISLINQGYSKNKDEINAIIKQYPTLLRHQGNLNALLSEAANLQALALKNFQTMAISSLWGSTDMSDPAFLKKNVQGGVNEALKEVSLDAKTKKNLEDIWRTVGNTSGKNLAEVLGPTFKQYLSKSLSLEMKDAIDFNNFSKNFIVGDSPIDNAVKELQTRLQATKMELAEAQKTTSGKEIDNKLVKQLTKEQTAYELALAEAQNYTEFLSVVHEKTQSGDVPKITDFYDADSAKDSTHEVNLATLSIEALNTAIEKQMYLQDKLEKGSEAYRNSLKETNKLRREKLKLIESEINRTRAEAGSRFTDITDLKKLEKGIIEASQSVASSTSQLTAVAGKVTDPLSGKGTLTSKIGDARSYGGARKHEGIDLAAPSGTPIYATTAGTVIQRNWNEYGGWRVNIQDAEGKIHYYAHMLEQTALKIGDVVQAGQQIGKVGATGYSKTPGTSGKFGSHLHYGIYTDKSYDNIIDPEAYLKGIIQYVDGKSTSTSTGVADMLQDQEQAVKDYLSNVGEYYQTLREIHEADAEFWKDILLEAENVAKFLQYGVELSQAKAENYRQDSDQYRQELYYQVNQARKIQESNRKYYQELQNILKAHEEMLAQGIESPFSGDDISNFKEQLEQFEIKIADTSVLREIGDTMAESLMTGWNKFKDAIDFERRRIGNVDVASEEVYDYNLAKEQFAQLQQTRDNLIEEINALMMRMSEPRSVKDYAYFLSMYDNLNTKLQEAIVEIAEKQDELDGLSARAIQRLQTDLERETYAVKSVVELYNTLAKVIKDNPLYVEQSIELGTEAIGATEEYLIRLNKQWSELSKITPTNKAEADALAESMEGVAKSILDAEIQLRELQVQVYESGYKALFDGYEQAAKSLDRIINNTKANLDMIKQGYTSTDELILSTDYAQYAGYETRDEYEQAKIETQKLIDEERRRRETISQIRSKAWERDLDTEFNYYQKLYKTQAEFFEKTAKNLATYMYGNTDQAKDELAKINDIVQKYNEALQKGIKSSWRLMFDELQQYTKKLKDIGIAQGILSEEAFFGANGEVNNPIADDRVMIYHPNGKTSYGYAKTDEQGRKLTYLDPYGKQQLPEGSVVKHGDNYWEKKLGGGSINHGKTLPSQRTTGYQGIPATVALPDGSFTTATIKEDNRAYLLNGQEIPEGSVILAANGKYYQKGAGEVAGFAAATQWQMIKDNDLTSSTDTKIPYDETTNIEMPKIEYEPSDYEKRDTKYDDLLFKLTRVGLSDKIKDIVAEYKLRREAWDKGIQFEQDRIKALASAGIDVSKDIDKILDAISIQNLEDIQINFQIQQDALERQLELAQEMKAMADKEIEDAIKAGDNEWLKQAASFAWQVDEKLAELAESRRKAIDTYYDAFFNSYEEKLNRLERKAKEINFIKELNELVRPGNYATALTDLNKYFTTNQKITEELKKQSTELQHLLNTLPVGTYEWNKVNKELESVNDNLDESVKRLIELQQQVVRTTLDSELAKIEKNLLGGKTVEEVRKEREKYLNGLEKELAIQKIYNQIQRESLNLTSEQSDLLNSQGKIRKVELEKLQKELDIQQKQLELEKLRGQTTKQELTKMADGSFQYVFKADEEAIQTLEEQLLDAQSEFQNWLEDSRLNEVSEYLEDIRSIMEKALEGRFDSEKQWMDAMNSINAWGLNFSSAFAELNSIINAFYKYSQTVEGLAGIKPLGFDTGGYTGDFNGGKLALLHQKELVLNKYDTSNILQAVQMLRNFVAQVPNSIENLHEIGDIILNVEFPNATNAQEIKKVFTQDLLNEAKQRLAAIREG